tara:strand:- start:2883 stop:3080 length:198 start_codon:yes stop_codon:yes gene_type:complete
MPITDSDIQVLIAQNPLASEMLRRIVAERERAELQAELDKLNQNGKASIPDVAELIAATDKSVSQ